jgi:beta-galactosidase/beta-glucuronidase
VVVAAVNNVVPSRKGLFSSTHRFGGFYRDVELEATPDTRIDDAWVRGDFDRQEAEVHATVAFASEAARLKNPVLRVKITAADGEGSRKDAKTLSVGEKTQSPEAPWAILKEDMKQMTGNSPSQGCRDEPQPIPP